MNTTGSDRPSAVDPFAASTIPGPTVAEWISQREHVRWLRVQRHLAIAVPAAVLCSFVAPILHTLGGLPLFVVLVFVVLDSLARALDARLGYVWGWLYSEPKRSTRLDLIADRMIHRLLLAVPVADSPVSQVQVVDPTQW